MGLEYMPLTLQISDRFSAVLWQSQTGRVWVLAGAVRLGSHHGRNEFPAADRQQSLPVIYPPPVALKTMKHMKP